MRVGTLTQFDLQFPRRSDSDYVSVSLRRPSTVVQSLTACVWMRTRDLINYGTVCSYAVDSNWLTADAATNAFTVHDYASLKVSSVSGTGNRHPIRTDRVPAVAVIG